MKKHTIEPGAIHLMKSFRDIGYDFKTAIADLIDNSISAEADEVFVDINFQTDESPSHVVIADNGNGMNSEALKEAMRFAAARDYEHGKDLGKYGLGLKTASLSQCKILTVASKPKPKPGTQSRLSIMRWDIDEVYAEDKWTVLQPDVKDLEKWEKNLFDQQQVLKTHGTVVIWTDLKELHPDLYNNNTKERCVTKIMKNVEQHLRMVFHKFMQQKVEGKKRLKIILGNNRLKPWDPFCTDEEKTKPMDIMKRELSFKDKEGSIQKSKVTLYPFILPRKDEFSSEDKWRDASGPKKWNRQQGFYFYRNGRMLKSGGWSNLRSSDEHTKLLRIAIEFNSENDRSFSVNISKMKALIPGELREDLKKEIEKWASEARRVYDRKISPKPANTNYNRDELVIKNKQVKTEVTSRLSGITLTLGNEHQNHPVASKHKKKGEVNIILPPSHPSSVIFEKKQGKPEEIRDFCYKLLSILEAVQSKKLKPSDIPDLKELYKNLDKL